MSLSITRNHGFLGLSDEQAALEFPDKDGRVDIQNECHVKLFPTSSLSSARDSGFEELFWCRNRLLWSSHGRERVRIETGKHVMDATLCPMLEDDASVPVLCVAEQTLLTIYTAEGDIHHHTLPHPVKRLWPTPGALIVEHHGNKPAHVVQNCITGVERLKAITSRDANVPLESWESPNSALFKCRVTFCSHVQQLCVSYLVLESVSRGCAQEQRAAAEQNGF